MDRLGINKVKGRIPEFEWLDEERNGRITFSPESLNFNTIIRAFTNNNLQWKFLERKMSNYYLIKNGDVRLCEKRPDILKDDEKLRQCVNRIWRFATNVMII